jgi:hypothetical protein
MHFAATNANISPLISPRHAVATIVSIAADYFIDITAQRFCRFRLFSRRYFAFAYAMLAASAGQRFHCRFIRFLRYASLISRQADSHALMASSA